MGNTRVSFVRNSAGTSEILDTGNYYAFGLNHIGGNGLNSSGFGSWQSYKYNGKELQETGMYDYGARMYMSDLGRWGVIDPLAEQMTRYSPYNYAYNNPVSFIDPDGRKPQTPDTQAEAIMAPTTMLMFYASGGSGSQDLKDFLSNNEGTAMFQRLTRSMGLGEGGSGSVAFGETAAYRAIMAQFYFSDINFSPPGKSFLGRAIDWLFGSNKKQSNMVEVGPAKRIPFEEKKDNTWLVVSSLLFGNVDPYSAIGNAGVGSYAEERENVGIAAILFVNPEAAAEGLGRKALNKGLWTLTKEGASTIKNHKTFGTIFKSTSDDLWWAVDKAGHGGSKFKVFKETKKGLEWYKDADDYGDFIINKHKGATGTFIPWGQLSTVK